MYHNGKESRLQQTDYLSVSSLTKYLKLKFDRDPYLEKVYLTGEVSNFRKRPNHQYFSLKDDQALIQAVIWADKYRQLGFDLEEGMKVNVIGRVQLYEPSGSYSIMIEKIEPDGVGALAVQFEQLKNALQKEGLFNAEFKQTLPRFVKKIGVITSPSGAVIQDIITTVSRRFPGVEILLFPTKVQGEGAAQEVATTIQKANERDDVDVLIVGRGGGSIEDLWAFNEEIVVRAIFESRLPIISSVGHETDTTLADFVADRRAATPTAAAELATPVPKLDLLHYLGQQKNRASQALSHRLQYLRSRLDRVSQSVIFRQPERLYDGYLQELDHLMMRLGNQAQGTLREKTQEIQLLTHRLAGLDMPQKVERYQERVSQLNRILKSNMANIYDNKMARADKLIEALTMLDTTRIMARGYAIVEQGGHTLDSVEKIQTSQTLTLRMRDGRVDTEVKYVKKQENI